jgi:hypothetical protein
VSFQQTDGSTGTTTYAGNCQTTTDERGKSRKSCFDALGRLIQVFEDPSGLNYETDYGYDVLNNLTSVTQKGGAASTLWRLRSFTYDSLSRLTCAANPEITSGLGTVTPASCPATYTGTYTAGTVGYTYDADSELATKIAPAPNQTGRSHREVIPREISRALVLNLSGEKKRCLGTAQDIFALTQPSLLSRDTRQVIQREISRALVLNLSGKKAVPWHCPGYFRLDRAFALIEGHPAPQTRPPTLGSPPTS